MGHVSLGSVAIHFLKVVDVWIIQYTKYIKTLLLNNSKLLGGTPALGACHLSASIQVF